MVVKKEIVFRDPVVLRVVEKFVDRSDLGYKKYGMTMEDERLTGKKNLEDWLQDVQEELMDAILYIQSVRESIKDLKGNYLAERLYEIQKYEGLEKTS